MKLISLHMPKTAGMSFGKALEDYFGDALLPDYKDRGISKPAYERNKSALRSGLSIAKKGLSKFKCVHGHFLPVKYLLLSTSEDLTFITWMRDPVQRMVSHYNFWQRTYDAKSSEPHHKQVVEEGWTLEQFCLSPRFQNIYCQYLWAFPVYNFDFIGITEHYEEDLGYFSANFTSGSLKHEKINRSDNEAKVYTIDNELLKKIEQFHERDITLYNYALEKRKNREGIAQPIV